MATTTKKLVPGVDYPGSNVNPALSTPLPPGQPQSVPQAPIQPPTDPNQPVLINQSTNPTFVDRKTALAQANRDAQTQQENQLIQQLHTQILTPEQQQQIQDLTNNVGASVPNQPQIQQSQQNINPDQTFVNSPPLQNAIPSGLEQAAIGAGIGAVAGLATSAGVLSVPGAIVGAVAGFIRGTTSRLKEEANQNVAAKFTTLQANAKNLRYLVIDAKKDPEGAAAAFNIQLAAIDKHYAEIKAASQSDVNKFLGVDTQVEMAKLDNFYASGGLREIYINRMKAVLSNPSTNVSDLIFASDLENAT